MSYPSGPKILSGSSNFPAASTSAAAACCGLSKPFEPGPELAGAAEVGFVADSWPTKSTEADRHAHTTAHAVQGNLKRFLFADVDFMLSVSSDLAATSGFEPQLEARSCPRSSAPTTPTSAAEASASARSHAGGTAAAGGASARTVVSTGAPTEGTLVSAAG